VSAPASRRDLYARLRAVQAALVEAAVQPAGPVSAQDDPSRLLRNGLAVVSFAALEDFLRARTREALATLSNSGLAFGALPKKLQQAATEGALRAAISQLGFMDDKATHGMPMLQSVADAVASTSGQPYALSRYSLGYRGSNLSLADVPTVLKAFKVNGGWTQLTALASRAGFAALPLEDFYAQVLRRRHKAAHEGGTDIPLADITSFASGARACALAFELMLGCATERVVHGLGPTTAADVDLLFMESHVGGRRLVDENGTTLDVSSRSSSSTAFVRAAVTAHACLVARNHAGIPQAWYSCYA
jgi:hypothetical protein